MEQRQAAHHDVVRPGLDEGTDADLGVAAQIAVGEHGALGFSGGAGGVQDDRDIVVVALHRRVLARHLGDQRHQLGIVDQPALRADLGGTGSGLVGEGRRGEQRLGAAVGQVEGHLTGLEQRVHWDRDGAAVHDAVEHDGEGRSIGQHDSHPIAGLDAGLLQQRRHPGGCGVEFGEGELHIVTPQCYAVGVAIF